MINKTFKAAVLVQQNNNPPLSLQTLKEVEAQDGQVKVKMISSGLCGAQVNEMSGVKGEDKYVPHLMGHEGYGKVISIGQGVKKVKTGDYVILHWRPSKGSDVFGGTYINSDDQKIGSGPVTTFSEVTIVSENRCTKVKPTSNMKLVYPLLGCALPTAYGAIKKEAKLKQDDNVFIYGAGGLGMALLFWCKVFNIDSVTVADIHDKKKDQVKELNGKFIHINDIKDLKDSYDCIFETTGYTGNVAQSLEIANKLAKIILIGQTRINESVTFSNFLKFYDGIQIISSQGGLFDPDEDMQILCDYIETNSEEALKLISHKIDLEDINYGFELMKTPDARRVIIDF